MLATFNGSEFFAVTLWPRQDDLSKNILAPSTPSKTIVEGTAFMLNPAAERRLPIF
jgi:hypothetical protein